MALERLVAQQLLAWCDYSQKKASLYFWRTRLDLEVDFIVYGEENFYTFEVKNTKKIVHSDLKGLQTFLEDYLK